MMTRVGKPKAKLKKIKISKTTCYRVVPVWLIGKHGKILANLVFDEAASECFVETSLLEEAGIKGSPQIQRISMLNGNTYTIQNESCELHLESLDGTFSTKIMANSTEQINDMIPVPDYNELKKDYPYMENIKFPKLAKKPIEILVGFNYPGVHIALAADISGKNIREPSCRKTVFGNTAIYRAMEPPSTIMLTQVMKEARLERL
jgi:hypothetical protein